MAGTVQENWVKVEISIDRGTHYEYTCTRLTGAPHAFPIGTTFVNYGASGDGVIRFDSEDTHQPFIETLTHSGRPDTTVVRHAVMGNLEAFTGADEWGLVVGADLDAFADNYLVLSEDRFELHRDLDVTTGKGFQFADGGIAGWVLTDDGTGLFVPAASAGGVLPIPTGRGYILRSNAVPVFVEYLANTNGAVLIGDGVDITSDTTPTFVDTVTLDDGASHSPNLRFVGGSNDDTAHIQLIDDAVAGNSDLAVILAADDADSQFMIRNASGATKAWIDAVGAASFIKNVLINYSTGEVVSLKASGVAHGATGLTETDNFGQMILSSADGGLVIRGFLDTASDNQPIAITGVLSDTTSTTKSSAGRSLVELHGAQVTGTNFGNVVDDGNVVGFRVYTGGAWSTTLISDENGGLWLPGTIDASDASIRVQMDDTGVTDAGPTDAELDGIFGTPATVGDGFFAFVDDGGAHARIFGCVSDGTNWWWQRWFIAA